MGRKLFFSVRVFGFSFIPPMEDFCDKLICFKVFYRKISYYYIHMDASQLTGPSQLS
jgi:hypothetical protein